MKVKHLFIGLASTVLLSGSVYAASVNQLAKACGQGDAVACGNLGDAYENGKGTKKSLTKALDAYRIACDNGRARACTGVGRVLQEMAFGYYAKGCEGNDGKACRRYALIYPTIYGSENANKANKYWAKACELNDLMACWHHGSRLVFRSQNEKKESAKVMYAQGVKYVQKACNVKSKYQSDACSFLKDLKQGNSRRR